MDTRSGFITSIPEEIEAIPEEHREALTQEEYEELQKVIEAERVKYLEHYRANHRHSEEGRTDKLKPKDAAKKARTRKKIADASRKRNRK